MTHILFLILFLLPDGGSKPDGKNDEKEVQKQTMPTVSTLRVIPVGGPNANVAVTIPEPIVSYKQPTPVNSQLLINGVSFPVLTTPGNTAVKTTTPTSTSVITH